MDNEYRESNTLGHACVILNGAKRHPSQAGQQNNAAALTVFMRLTSVAFMTLQLMRPGQNHWTQGGPETEFNPTTALEIFVGSLTTK